MHCISSSTTLFLGSTVQVYIVYRSMGICTYTFCIFVYHRYLSRPLARRWAWSWRKLLVDQTRVNLRRHSGASSWHVSRWLQHATFGVTMARRYDVLACTCFLHRHITCTCISYLYMYMPVFFFIYTYLEPLPIEKQEYLRSQTPHHQSRWKRDDGTRKKRWPCGNGKDLFMGNRFSKGISPQTCAWFNDNQW